MTDPAEKPHTIGRSISHMFQRKADKLTKADLNEMLKQAVKNTAKRRRKPKNAMGG